MFIFDFVAETVLDQIIDWLYGKIIGFLNDFFVMMNNMGVELFDLPWVEAVTTFFGYFGWALFGVGLVVGAFECAIEYQGGRGSIKDTAMNYIKGFMAVNLFTIVPVNLYSVSIMPVIAEPKVPCRETQREYRLTGTMVNRFTAMNPLI